MTKSQFPSSRFTLETGFHVTVQVPESHTDRVMAAIMKTASLEQGDYDSVAFRTAQGVQQFRSLGTGHNPESPGVVEIPCLELGFFMPNDPRRVTEMLEAIYHAHPYEEPVIRVQDASRTRHIPGLDEGNPNRIWNSPDAEWYKPKS
ncbi:MAG: hypothetical protein AAF641_11340 [Pseudomonadota bacterium]